MGIGSEVSGATGIERCRGCGLRIDIGGDRHVVAVVDANGKTLVRAVSFSEDAGGYARLRELLGKPGEGLVAMEATGHYWRNLFAFLVTHGFAVALLNPLRTRRFAEEELARTKTDVIDALGIAHFAAQKRPAVTPVTEQLVDDLRETVRLREQLVAEFSDALRRLHRARDLSFPEFTHHVRWLKGGSRPQSSPVIRPLVRWPLCQCENSLHCFMTVASRLALIGRGA
jgi:transposase